MSAEIIDFPCRFNSKKSADADKNTSHNPSPIKDRLEDKTKNKRHIITGRAYEIFHTILVIGWKLWAFILFCVMFWEGFMALLTQETPHTHYGTKFLLVLLLFIVLSVMRFVKPRSVSDRG